MRKIAPLAAALATALVVPALGLAAGARDSYVRRHLSFTEQGAFRPGYQDGLSVNLVTPPTWSAVRSSKPTFLAFHQGSSRCRYSISVTTRLAADTRQTPAEHVAAALPVPSSPYLLDQGTRNSSTAWRVIRLARPGSSGSVSLRAMRADHRHLGTGDVAWQETVVAATSRSSDECHAGTYRSALGPQIGDALATATGRAYLIRRGR